MCLRFRTECGVVGIVLDAKLRLVTLFLPKELGGAKERGVAAVRRKTNREGRNTSQPNSLPTRKHHNQTPFWCHVITKLPSNVSRHKQTPFQSVTSWPNPFLLIKPLIKTCYSLYHAKREIIYLRTGIFVQYENAYLPSLTFSRLAYTNKLKMDRKLNSSTSQSKSMRTSSYSSHLGHRARLALYQMYTFKKTHTHTNTHTCIDFPQIPPAQEMSE